MDCQVANAPRNDEVVKMRSTPLEHKIAELARPVAEDLGLEIVQVKVVGEDGSQNVQIMAEDPNTGRILLDDCAKLSKAVATVMDVEDPISGAYRLEVSSPGIDRPLTRLKDFATYEGFDAKIESDTPNDIGQKRFRGILKGIKDDQILIDTEQGPAEVAFGSLVKAKLVLTDDLIEKTKTANL